MPIWSDYMIRKLTRHYYAEFIEFAFVNEKSTDSPSQLINSELNRIKADLDNRKRSLSKDVDEDTMRKQYFKELIDLQDGINNSQDSDENSVQNKFFEKLSDNKTIIVFAKSNKGIILSALIDFSDEPYNGKRVAKLSHIITTSIARPDENYENALLYQKALFSDFFGLIERYAGSRAIHLLKVSVSHPSLLIRYLADNKAFSIKSHGLHNNSVVIDFLKYLLQDFAGDTHNWLDFCRWYLSLSFGHVAKIPETPEIDKGIPRFDFSITNEYISDAYKIPVRAISIDKKAVEKLNTNELTILKDPTKYTFLMVDDDIQGKLPSQYDNFDKKNARDLLLTLQSVKIRYLNLDNGWYCDSSLPDENKKDFIKQWFPLKSGRDPDQDVDQDVDTCAGVIVEIDRGSYKKLVETRLPRNDHQLLFFNSASFGEKMVVGSTLFFFVWDSNSADKKTSTLSSGVLCAYGTINKKPEKLSISEIQNKWSIVREDGESYSSQAIFENSFLNQYFRDEVIGFYLTDIKYFKYKKTNSYQKIQGISYECLRDILCPPFDDEGTSSEKEQKQFATQLLPVWDVGNTYLTNDLVNRLKERLKSTATEHSIIREQDMTTKIKIDPVKIFICYAREDEKFKEALDKCFTSLKRDGFVDVWHDRRIEPGEDWESAIKEALNQCKLGVLLISNDFLDSSFIHLTELPELLKRRGEGLKLIPILVRPSTFKTNPILKKLQVIPDPTRTVIEYPENTGERERVWLDIFEKIKEQVEKMRNL